MKAQAVSIRADRPYIKALNELASRKGKTTADFVRDTFDDLYAKELEPLISFFAQDGNNSSQSAITTDEAAQVA